VNPRKRFGQHFLAPAWADKVVNAIAPSRDDRFLEIGPGPGALTLRLAPRVEHLTAIEIDRDLAAQLQPQLPAHVDLVVGDFLEVDLAPFLTEGPVRVVGNLPYNLSSPILFKLLEMPRTSEKRGQVPFTEIVKRGQVAFPDRGHSPKRDLSPFSDATVMLQLEVADRLVATAGTKDYGVLTIFTALRADVQRVLTLPPGAFRPAPKVHSAVVRLTFRASPLPPDQQQAFEKMVRTIFTQRRKTLANALRPYAESVGQEAKAVLTKAGIDPIRRPETLSQEDLLRLVSVFASGGLKPDN
jgi:16S rRNA (adenine1518-N6/adenine1519-N6)-dimethyltransferase